MRKISRHPTGKLLGLLVALFFFTVVLVSVRDPRFLRVYSRLDRHSDWRYETTIAQICPTLVTCFRVGSALSAFAIDQTMLGAANLIGLTDTVYPENFDITYTKKRLFIQEMADFASRMLSLSPLVLVAYFCFGGLLEGIGFLSFAFLTLCGWGFKSLPYRVNIMFYDYAATGLLYFVCYYFWKKWKSGEKLSSFRFIPILVVGQLIYENEGMVMGIAFCVFQWIVEKSTFLERIKRFAINLTLFGLTALLLTKIMITLITLANGMAYLERPGRSVLEHVALGKFHNSDELAIILKGFRLFFGLPFLVGIGFGALSNLFKFKTGVPLNNIQIPKIRFIASFSITVGFMCTVVIGLYTAKMLDEFGRQTLPLATLLVFSGCQVGEMLAIYFSRVGSPMPIEDRLHESHGEQCV